MAYDDLYCRFFSNSHSHCLDCNFHSFGAEAGDGGVQLGLPFCTSADRQMSLLALQSPASSPDRSTGYLEDALAERAGGWCKRRRMVVDDVEHMLQEFLNWSCDGEEPFAVSNCPGSDPGDAIYGAGDLFDHATTTFKEAGAATTTLQQQTNILPSSSSYSSCSSSSFSSKSSTTTARAGHDAKNKEPSEERCSLGSLWFKGEGAGNRERRRRKGREEQEADVVYPFTVVKPGGVEGDVTLDDINRRILRRPTRPIRHPVGEFACLPCVSTANGPGLSGKAVVGLVRIHTQGRGTVTIIRTRG